MRKVVDRLTDARQDAPDVVVGALEYSGERALVDDAAQPWITERLEATLVDARDILEGASADVRGILEGGE